VQLTRKGEAIGMLGNNENFGLDDYVRACEAHGSHFLREPAQTSHSARTMTYCDVMILTIEELTGALAHDSVWRDRLDHLHAERANGAASEPKAKRWRLSLSFSKKKIGLSKKSGITPSMSHTKAFNLLDKDSSGSISVSELKAALVKEGSSDVLEAEIQSLIDQVDVSGDGELQLDEFETFWDLFQASCAVVVEPVREKVKTNPADASIVSAVVPAITEDVKKDPVDAFIVGAMRPIKEGVKARKLTDAEERARRVNQALAEQRKLDATVPMTPTKEEVNTVEVKARKLAAWMTRRQPGIG